MEDNLKQLVGIAYDIISEEHLPRPKFIKMRNSLSGVKSRMACCHRIRDVASNSCAYNITVNIISARFVKCTEGKYVDRKTGERFRRAIGDRIPFAKIVEHTAHEIAHLKYWKHNLQHRSYTQHILDKLKQRLGMTNEMEDETKCQQTS